MSKNIRIFRDLKTGKPLYLDIEEYRAAINWILDDEGEEDDDIVNSD